MESRNPLLVKLFGPDRLASMYHVSWVACSSKEPREIDPPPVGFRTHDCARVGPKGVLYTSTRRSVVGCDCVSAAQKRASAVISKLFVEILRDECGELLLVSGGEGLSAKDWFVTLYLNFAPQTSYAVPVRVIEIKRHLPEWVRNKMFFNFMRLTEPMVTCAQECACSCLRTEHAPRYIDRPRYNDPVGQMGCRTIHVPAMPLAHASSRLCLMDI